MTSASDPRLDQALERPAELVAAPGPNGDRLAYGCARAGGGCVGRQALGCREREGGVSTEDGKAPIQKLNIDPDKADPLTH